MKILQICPPHHLTCRLPDGATLPRKSKSFSTVIFIHTFDYLRYLKIKQNFNCCTAALAVYLLLFSASYYLLALSPCLGHTEGGPCVWSSSQRYGRVEAVACCDTG